MSLPEQLSPQLLRFSARLTAAGYLMGIALGGFFDGILLHQVLQWHHLLSLVNDPVVQDIRIQILADGLFHVLMYVIASIGLVLLWKSRVEFARTSAGNWLFGTVLLGFGIWNVVDVGLFHWILRIHRIKVDSSAPLFWDLLWLVLFGLPFLLAGWIVRSQSGPGDGSRNRGHVTAVTSLISAGLITAGTVAGLPPPASGVTTVMFMPGTEPNQVFRTFDAANAKVISADRTGTVWSVKMPNTSGRWQLYRNGALLVSNSVIGMGCLAWLRI